MRPLVLAVVLLAALTACDPYNEVQEADTIEAFEEYIANYPTSRFLFQSEVRLEELYFEKAETEKTLEAYDVYIEKYPEGIHRDKAIKHREEHLYMWSVEQNSIEGWQRFLDEYGTRGEKKRVVKAKRAIAVAEYADNLLLGEPTISRVNMAEDPEGPENGWGVEVEVTNKGAKVLKKLELTIAYKSAEGHIVARESWPVVAERWAVPMEEEKKVPMKKGDTRTWQWSTGDAHAPKEWDTKSVEVYPSSVQFVE